MQAWIAAFGCAGPTVPISESGTASLQPWSHSQSPFDGNNELSGTQKCICCLSPAASIEECASLGFLDLARGVEEFAR
jgi:hypothetical protein